MKHVFLYWDKYADSNFVALPLPVSFILTIVINIVTDMDVERTLRNIFYLTFGIWVSVSSNKDNIKRAVVYLVGYCILYAVGFLANNYSNIIVLPVGGTPARLARVTIYFVVITFIMCRIKMSRTIQNWVYFGICCYHVVSFIIKNSNNTLNLSEANGTTTLYIGFAFFGFIIGQLYYQDRTSPLLTVQRLNDYKIMRPVLWCGRKAALLYVLYFLLTPLIFFALFRVF
jgi:hypothetical protein